MATIYRHDVVSLVPRYLSSNTSVGSDLGSQIDAYSLPYGVLGILAHLLTCYVILCHYFGRKPSVPTKYLEYDRFNIAVVVIGSIVSTTLTVVTMVRVRGSAPLMALAGMQLVLSGILKFITIQRYSRRKRETSKGWDGIVALWGLPLLAVSLTSVYFYGKFDCKFLCPSCCLYIHHTLMMVLRVQ